MEFCFCTTTRQFTWPMLHKPPCVKPVSVNSRTGPIRQTWPPSDFYLFRYLKPHLKGKRFENDEAVKHETESWLEGQSEEWSMKTGQCEDWHKNRIEMLKRRYEKCIELNGGYVEKE